MRKCAHEGILLFINKIKYRGSVALSISELLKKKLGQSESVSPSYGSISQIPRDEFA